MANRDFIFVDGDINHGGVGGNYGVSAAPTSADVFRYGYADPLKGPLIDGGSARTWGGVDLHADNGSVDGFSGTGGSIFQNISLEGNCVINFDTGGCIFASINGDANTTFDVNQFVDLLNQASGKTCTPKGRTILSLGSGLGTIAFGALLDSSIRDSQTLGSSFTGIVSVDTVTITDAASSTLTATAIRKLVFTNGGKLYNIFGPSGEQVWTGVLSAVSTTAGNWGTNGIPTDGANVYIDSRISVGGSTLATLNQLPLTWSTIQSLAGAVFADGGGKNYSWTGTDLTTIVLVNTGTVTIAGIDDSGTAVIGSGCILNCASQITGTFGVSGTGKLSLPVTFTGTIINQNSSPTVDKIDLNGSVLSASAAANLSPSAAAFTNYTVSGGSGGIVKNLLLMGVG